MPGSLVENDCDKLGVREEPKGSNQRAVAFSSAQGRDVRELSYVKCGARGLASRRPSIRSSQASKKRGLGGTGMMQPERSIQGFSSKYGQNSFTYDVKRDVNNEETFQQQHRRKTISSRNLDFDITTLSHHVQCRRVCARSLSCHQTGNTKALPDPFGAYFCLPPLNSCHQNP
ncbi:Testis anion transporter 1 [Manis javanica]|nr:Testis anion transporter 1 [Manis javanica]